jgi:hypothetical protein
VYDSSLDEGKLHYPRAQKQRRKKKTKEKKGDRVLRSRVVNGEATLYFDNGGEFDVMSWFASTSQLEDARKEKAGMLIAQLKHIAEEWIEDSAAMVSLGCCEKHG